ncbi:MAG: zinc ribbon domain-containing protein, partial [Chloroflexota bacterium]
AGPAAPRSGPRSGAYGGGAPATTRYCGTCGAEIEPGRQFCGQCGTPVAGLDEEGDPRTVGALRRGTFPPAAYAEYDEESWSPADQDAPTEQFIPPYTRPGAPYRQSGFYESVGRPTGGGMSREMLVVLGIFCILGGLVSGAGAIVLALLH